MLQGHKSDDTSNTPEESTKRERNTKSKDKRDKAGGNFEELGDGRKEKRLGRKRVCD